MAKLESLTIKNFRGFDKLEISGFSKINLFLGKNNSGKTSVLEALFILMGMSNSTLPGRMNQRRGLKFNIPEHFKCLFHKFDYNNKPDISGVFDDASKRQLQIEPVFQQDLELIEDLNAEVSKATNKLKGLDLNFSLDAGNKYISSLVIEKDKLVPYSPKEYNEMQSAFIISSDTEEAEALQNFSEIVKRKETGKILSLLQSFDSRIQDVKPLTDGIYFDMQGLDELVPLNIMGDGIRRFFGILTGVSVAKGAVILIDEIENGMHFSAHKLLWKGLLAMAEQYDIQLFVTTHNLEALTSLKAVLGDNETSASMRESVCAFTISNTANAGFKSYRYSSEAFQDAINHEMELRS